MLDVCGHIGYDGSLDMTAMQAVEQLNRTVSGLHDAKQRSPIRFVQLQRRDDRGETEQLQHTLTNNNAVVAGCDVRQLTFELLVRFLVRNKKAAGGYVKTRFAVFCKCGECLPMHGGKII